MDANQKLSELKTACQIALDIAQKKGAEIYVAASHGIQSKIAYEKNDYNIATHHDGLGLSITLHKDQKSSSTSINTFNPKDIEAAIKICLDMAQYSIADSYLGLAPKSDYIELPMFFDQSIIDLSMKELKSLTSGIINYSLEEERIIIDSVNVEKSVTARVIANSRGMLAHDYNASLNWFIMGMARSGDDLTSMDYYGDFAHNTENLEQKIHKTFQTFKEKVCSCLNAKKGASFKGHIILPPSLTEEFILDPVIFHLKGNNIMDGKSRWGEQLNQKICHENLTIEDHPHDTDLRGCTAFSGEGIPTQTMTIVESGIAKKHLETVYSSNKRKTKPTGNGSGPHSAFINPGEHSWKALAQQIPQLIIPTRFSGNLDPLSGDFSGIAKGAQFYRNGERQHCLKETMIAGNIYDMINTQVHFSKELESDFGYYKLPYSLVDGISITST